MFGFQLRAEVYEFEKNRIIKSCILLYFFYIDIGLQSNVH